jgi:hypothetical protein
MKLPYLPTPYAPSLMSRRKYKRVKRSLSLYLSLSLSLPTTLLLTPSRRPPQQRTPHPPQFPQSYHPNQKSKKPNPFSPLRKKKEENKKPTF